MLLSKRTLSILLLIVLVLQVTGAGSKAKPAALATQVSLSLSPASVTIPAQRSFSEDVIVDCGANAEGVGIVVTFDPSLLQVVSVDADESQFPLVLRNEYDNRLGIVWYDVGAPLGCHAEGNCPSGTARIATITFRAVAQAPQTAYIHLRGQVTWSGEYIFSGEGSGSTVTILPPPVMLYLPLVTRHYR